MDINDETVVRDLLRGHSEVVINRFSLTQETVDLWVRIAEEEGVKVVYPPMDPTNIRNNIPI